VNQQEFEDTLRNELIARWQTAQAIFEGSSNFTIISKTWSYFLFVECNYLPGEECYNYFLANGLSTITGSRYGYPGAVRFNLGGANSVIWSMCVERLQNIVNSLK